MTYRFDLFIFIFFVKKHLIKNDFIFLINKIKTMPTILSDKVVIFTETFYQGNGMYNGQLYFMFAYQISIVNTHPFDIQLQSREWTIFDSLVETTKIQGEGVVGETPVIYAGESYQYVSGCNLMSEFGSMKGFYHFKNLSNQSEFSVEISSFDLVVPYKNN
jgi:ApaG protein